MDHSQKDLGLSPDLSRLTWEMRNLIQHGDQGGHLGRSEVGTAVCAEMFGAGYGIAEIWMVMTEPTNGISKGFFEKDGEWTEDYLEKIIFRAHEEANQSKSSNE